MKVALLWGLKPNSDSEIRHLSASHSDNLECNIEANTVESPYKGQVMLTNVHYSEVVLY